MNKMKEAAVRLRDHLGKDGRGAELLKEMFREANGTRKALAAAQPDIDKAHEAVSQMRRALDECQRAEAALREEVRRAKEEVSACRAKIAEKQAQIEHLERVLEPPINLTPREKSQLFPPNRARFKELFKALRKAMPVPPDPITNRGGGYSFELTDVVDDYKDEQYRRLGMFVVVSCVLNMPVRFALTEARNRLDILGCTEWKGGEAGKFLRWAQDVWISRSEKWKERIYDASYGFPPRDPGQLEDRPGR